MTQNGHWSGWLAVDGARVDVGSDWAGTRDRSWGIRPVGAAEPQPPPQGNFHQFFWLWTPCNFADRSLFFHSNDDGEGNPWNRRAVLVSGKGAERHFADPAFAAEWQPGTRRLNKLTADFDGSTRLTLTPSGPLFAMSGLGYTHPVWGHGFDHGALEVAHDSLAEAKRQWGNPLAMHVQALVSAELTDGDRTDVGVGVLEQLFVGSHAPTGLSGLMDPAA